MVLQISNEKLQIFMNFLTNQIVLTENTTANKQTRVQCNLDLVTLLVSSKTVAKLLDVTKSNDFM